MYLALLGLIAGVVVFQKLRPRFQHWLIERVAREPAKEGKAVAASAADGGGTNVTRPAWWRRWFGGRR